MTYLTYTAHGEQKTAGRFVVFPEHVRVRAADGAERVPQSLGWHRPAVPHAAAGWRLAFLWQWVALRLRTPLAALNDHLATTRLTTACGPAAGDTSFMDYDADSHTPLHARRRHDPG